MHAFVREKSRYEEVSEPEMLKAEPSLSESNIEQIKIKINKTKPRSQKATSAWYRFFLFLFALLGCVWILFTFWQTFDFLALIFAWAAMGLFLSVTLKAMNLWTKSIFSSLYFWIAIGLVGIGIWGVFVDNHNSLKERIYTNITETLSYLKGEELEETNQELIFTGYQSSGEVGDIRLSGVVQLTGLQQQKISLSGDSQVQSSFSGYLIDASPSEQPSEQQTWESKKMLPKEQELSLQHSESDLKKQVTILDAIKHLILEHNIPLSTSKTVKFSHVAMSSADYPYMKTALEKKMIWSTTNPNTLVSCDVYMVMKGLAQNRAIAKSADVKAAYRQAAKAKNQLNGCQQGAKLTTVSL